MVGAGREAIVFTARYVMQWGAKAGHTVGISAVKIMNEIDLITLNGFVVHRGGKKISSGWFSITPHRRGCCQGRRTPSRVGSATQVAQFIAVCSSSILAEALCLSSPFSGQSREKRRVSEKRLSLLIDSFQLSTKSDKLSDTVLPSGPQTVWARWSVCGVARWTRLESGVGRDHSARHKGA
jgi:hypothetical protein